MSKPHKSFEEQVKHISVMKNILVDSPSNAQLAFKLFNYTNLISPYKVYFYSGLTTFNQHEYLQQVDFKKYLNYYREDKEASKYIQSVCYELETYFTTALIHVLSSIIEDKPNVLNNRVDQIKQDLKKNIRANGTYSEAILQESTNEIDCNKEVKVMQSARISYYDPYRNWLTLSKKEINLSKINVFIDPLSFSLGEKIALYNIMKDKDRLKVIDVVGMPGVEDIKKMKSYLETLRKARNAVSHFENLTVVIDRQFIQYGNKKLKDGKNIEELKSYPLKYNCMFGILSYAKRFFEADIITDIADLICLDESMIDPFIRKISNSFDVRKRKMLTFHSKYFKIPSLTPDIQKNG